MLVKISLKIALASKRGAAMSKRLAGTGEAVERQRPIDVRMARDDRRPRHRRASWSRRSAPAPVRADDRGMPCKAAAELAIAFQRKADRSKRRGQRNRAVGDVEHEIGQSERLVARRRHQLVDLAPADAAIDQLPAQPNSASDDAVDFEAAVPFQPRFDMREARDQVGLLGSPMTRLLTSWVRRPTRSRW